MTSEREARLYELQGGELSLALADGSRIDDATLVSVSASVLRTAWLYTNGADLLVPLAAIVDYRERPVRTDTGVSALEPDGSVLQKLPTLHHALPAALRPFGRDTAWPADARLGHGAEDVVELVARRLVPSYRVPRGSRRSAVHPPDFGTGVERHEG